MSDGSKVEAEIVEKGKIENTKGFWWFVVYNIPNYGIAQPFYYDEKKNYAKKRQINSGIPKEFFYILGKFYFDQT